MTPYMPPDFDQYCDPRPAPIPRRRTLTPLGWAALGTFALLAIVIVGAAVWPMVFT